MKPRTQCPNCGAQWGVEEMDWEECFACGYPDADWDEWDDDPWDDEDDDFEGITVDKELVREFINNYSSNL